MKKCSNKKCEHGGKLQPIHNFTNSKRHKDGLKPWCRSCVSKNQAKRYQRIKSTDKEKYKKIIEQSLAYYHRVKPDLKRKYGITIEEFKHKLDSQNNCCTICKVNFNTLNKRPSVDHNHSTGKVRDLLCNNCNTIIGLCNESIEILKNTIEYLVKHSSLL